MTPPGFHRPPVSISRVGKSIAATVSKPAYDGSQLCAGDPMFTAEGEWDDLEIGRMFGLCDRCPFYTACLDYAIAHERHNYYAGTTPAQRNRHRKAFGILVVEPGLEPMYGLEPARRTA